MPNKLSPAQRETLELLAKGGYIVFEGGKYQAFILLRIEDGDVLDLAQAGFVDNFKTVSRTFYLEGSKFEITEAGRSALQEQTK